MQGTRSRIAVMGLSTALAATMLAACDRADDSRTAGQPGDTVVAQADRKMDNAPAKAGAPAQDMAITAELKTQLARDDRLAAMNINVETAGGQVTLRGTAPDAASRDHATALARSISGVSGVDNQLTLK